MKAIKRKSTPLRTEVSRSLQLWQLRERLSRLPTVAEVMEAVDCGRTTARRLRAQMAHSVDAGAGLPVPIQKPRRKKLALRRETDAAPF